MKEGSRHSYADQRGAQIAKGLTLDEARRIASNIAKYATGGVTIH